MKVLTSILPSGVWVLPVEQVERLRREFPGLSIVDAPQSADRLRELPDTTIAFLSRLTPEEFAVARRLRWIQSPAAGVGGLLFPALRESDVLLTNARGIHGEPIAEHVIAVTIVLFRQVQHAIRRQVAHEWGKDELQLSAYRSIKGRCIGIVGLGAIGSAIADKAAALGMRVIAVRGGTSTPRGPPRCRPVYPPEDLRTLLAEADVVVLAAPLTAETTGLIGTAELRLHEAGCRSWSTSRGGQLVREDELAGELARGTIGGAALDVFEHEPLDAGQPALGPAQRRHHAAHVGLPQRLLGGGGDVVCRKSDAVSQRRAVAERGGQDGGILRVPGSWRWRGAGACGRCG